MDPSSLSCGQDFTAAKRLWWGAQPEASFGFLRWVILGASGAAASDDDDAADAPGEVPRSHTSTPNVVVGR